MLKRIFSADNVIKAVVAIFILTSLLVVASPYQDSKEDQMSLMWLGLAGTAILYRHAGIKTGGELGEQHK